MKRKKRGSSRYFFLFFFLIVLLVVVYSSAKMALQNVTYFEIKNIEVESAKNLEQSYLINLCKDFVGHNLFSISKSQILTKYENIIRVKGISIKKKIPHTLRIVIEERLGVFFVKTKDGNLFPIDNERIVLDNDVFYESEALLPIISTDLMAENLFYGEKVSDSFIERVFAFTQKVKELDDQFLTNVSEFYQYDNELYVVEADTGYRILFSEDELPDQLARYRFIEGNRIFAKDNIIDLRFSDQLIIRTEGM
jgi:cell division septal protein FtsQ